MIIGLEVLDNIFNDILFENFENGNPGVGGSEFNIVLLGYYLKSTYPEYEIIIFHQNLSNKYPTILKTVEIDSINSIPEILSKYCVDIYISSLTKRTDEWYEELAEYKIKMIYFANNFPSKYRLRLYAKHKAISRVVFKTNEEYDKYIDDDIILKSDIVGNIIPDSYGKREINYREPIVLFLGGLYPQKGFHILAKQWKRIHKKIPSAKLYVLGSGKLYDKNAKMGKYDLAQEDYEKEFIKFLTDKDGNILPSVHFLGTVGSEKRSILPLVSVGVVNPSAKTETFCNSAVELQRAGIPVVTKAANSFLDVIVDKKSGFLFHTQRGMRRYIIKLLKNKELNKKMGEYGRQFSYNFGPEPTILKWREVLDGVIEGRAVTYKNAINNIWYGNKFINVFIRFLRFKLGIKCIYSRAQFAETRMEIWIKFKKKIKNKMFG